MRSARLLLLACVLGLCVPASARADASCDRFAGPFGSDTAAGTLTQPFKTAQRLADVLAPGQTGCLLAGAYTHAPGATYVLRFNRGGSLGAPITIRSAPGQRASLRGIVYVPRGSNHVTISHLDIDPRRNPVDETNGIQVMAEDTVIEHNRISNDAHRTMCIMLGTPGWGEAIRTVIRGNLFTDCGPVGNKFVHSIYVDWTNGTLITDNVFVRSGGWAVHLYPDAHNTTVTHNVMVGGGGGLIYAGEGDAATSDTNVSENIVTGSTYRPGIEAWWGGAVGQRNVARDNCLFGNAIAQVDVSSGGFTAAGNVIANPRYQNAAADDYRIAADSPCLTKVGYDTAARVAREYEQSSTPAPTPAPTPSASPSPSPSPTTTAAPTGTPTPTPSPTATATSTPAPTRTPTPTPSPSPTATPSPAPTRTPAPSPTAPPATTATPEPTPPSPGTGPEPDPAQEPVEAAVVFVDSAAFSASGGSVKAPKRPRGSRRRR